MLFVLRRSSKPASGGGRHINACAASKAGGDGRVDNAHPGGSESSEPLAFRALRISRSRDGLALAFISSTNRRSSSAISASDVRRGGRSNRPGPHATWARVIVGWASDDFRRGHPLLLVPDGNVLHLDAVAEDVWIPATVAGANTDVFRS